MPQMLSAYSRMLRSLENGPMLSALITDLRVHSSGLREQRVDALLRGRVGVEIRQHQEMFPVAQSGDR